MLTALVHDIRTPLSAMAGWFEVLESQLDRHAAPLIDRALTGLQRGISGQTRIASTVTEQLAMLEAGPGGPVASACLATGLRQAATRLAADAAGDEQAQWRALAAGSVTPTAGPGAAELSEGLALACRTLLEVLAIAAGSAAGPIRLDVAPPTIRLSVADARGMRDPLRRLCDGVQSAGSRRPGPPVLTLWLARAVLLRGGVQLSLDDQGDHLTLWLTSAPRDGVREGAPSG